MVSRIHPQSQLPDHGICQRHGLPGFSHNYSESWEAYQKTENFLFLAACFTECRRLGWSIPGPLLDALNHHFTSVSAASDIHQARHALGVGTTRDGGENQYRQAHEQADKEELQHLFDAVAAFGVNRIGDQIKAIAKLTGRTEAAIKQAYYRHVEKVTPPPDDS